MISIFSHYRYLLGSALLSAALAVAFTATSPFPLDDHHLYQAFVVALASGSLDLSIAGFHGSDIFAVPIHWITASPISQIYLQILAGILIPLLGYAAGLRLFFSRKEAFLFACILGLMPFIIFPGLRGWTGSAYFCLMLSSIALVKKVPIASGVLFALAILTKPFAVVLAPLLWLLLPDVRSKKIQWFVLPGLIVLAYLILQYIQAGQIMIGAHPDLSVGTAMQGPKRIIMNIAHGMQILFSVHNYYYPDPALTGPGNMMHTSPVLTFLGLFAILSKDFWSVKWRRALLLGFIIGMGLNALLDHMDHYYMDAGILVLIIASIPVLARMPLWIPIALATLHFQWLYFWLEFVTNFNLSFPFFAPLVLVDLFFIGFCLAQRKKIYGTLRELLT